MNRTMACSTCHMQAAGFSDARESDKVGRDVSLGDDGISLGDRNAPTAAYARFTPPFGKNAAGEYVGGQFWDGRASCWKTGGWTTAQPDRNGHAG